jgi:hypothetical protein
MEANIPKGSKVLLEQYAPQPTTRDFHILIARDGAIIPFESILGASRVSGWIGHFGGALAGSSATELENELRRNGVEYIILSEWLDRYRAENTERSKRPIKVYEAILAMSAEVKTFTSGGRTVGPPLTILRFPTK